MFRWSCGLLLVAGLTGFGAEKLPVPGDTDLQAVRTRIRTLFKTEYAKTTPTAILVLVEKLTSAAAEEKGNPAARYVILTEAATLSLRAGNIERAIQIAREIDHDFETYELDTWLGSTFVETIGTKDRLADFKSIAKAEIATPTEGADRLRLAQQWLDVAGYLRADLKGHAFRRSQFWMRETINAQQVKGLERTEAEKKYNDINAEIDRADAKIGRFSLYQGKWVIKYINGYTHEYVVGLDGTLAFDRCISMDGPVFFKKEESRARLVRRDGTIVVSFANGGVIERFSLDRDKLVVDRFFPGTQYPKGTIANKGEGFREK